MGVGKINVYITALGQPCKIDNKRWVVAVAHCDGSVLNWSEGRYKNKPDGPWVPIASHVPVTKGTSGTMPTGWYYDSIPAIDGHVEIEVPPGRYVVVASKHTWFGIVQGFWVLYGNYNTEHAIINVGCNEDVCATLFSPTLKLCWEQLYNVILLAVRSAEVQKLVNQRDLKAVQEAAKVLDEKLVKPLTAKGSTPYEQQYLALLKGALESVETEETEESR